jgi:hypothetical protein
MAGQITFNNKIKAYWQVQEQQNENSYTLYQIRSENSGNNRNQASVGTRRHTSGDDRQARRATGSTKTGVIWTAIRLTHREMWRIS